MDRWYEIAERICRALEKQNEIYASIAEAMSRGAAAVEETNGVEESVVVEEEDKPQLTTENMKREAMQELIIANYDGTTADKEFVNKALAKAGVRRATDLQENGDCEVVWAEYKRLKGI